MSKKQNSTGKYNPKKKQKFGPGEMSRQFLGFKFDSINTCNIWGKNGQKNPIMKSIS